MITGANYREGLAYSSDGALYVALPSGSTIPSPTLSGNQVGNSYPLCVGGIPLIGLSSGSIAANGVISAITALPVAYPNAYCWFPANALATVKAAGWYYCTFSTTTAGIAFLDTYTSGVPTIPASPTPVVDGKGAFTGDTGEEFGHTITVPAGALGATGGLRIYAYFIQTNNANVKTGRIRFSGNAGTVFVTATLASAGQTGGVAQISNLGVSAQLSTVHAIQSGGAVAGAVTGAVDTSAATTLVLSIQRATATDNIVIHPPIIEVVRVS